jgi:hypothetical protein
MAITSPVCLQPFFRLSGIYIDRKWHWLEPLNLPFKNECPGLTAVLLTLAIRGEPTEPHLPFDKLRVNGCEGLSEQFSGLLS